MQYTQEAGKMASKLEELANEIVTDPDRLAEFVKMWTGGFYRYSIGNTMLIHSQRPNATMLAGGNQWKVKHGRFVVKGQWASRIFILAPIHSMVLDEATGIEHRKLTGYTTAFVFDISQTDGKPVTLGNAGFVKGSTKLTLDGVIATFGIEVIIGSESSTSGSTDGKTITLAKASKVAMLATYFHELAHCRLHWKDGVRVPHSHDTGELEAEAVSYIVCSAVGIENTASGAYIGNWHGDRDKLGNAGPRILSTAEAIIRALDTV